MELITFTGAHLKMLKVALNCAGIKDARCCPNGIHITTTHVESTDGSRLAWFPLSVPRAPGPHDDIIIPTFKVLAKTETVTIGLDDDHTESIVVTQYDRRGTATVSPRMDPIDGRFPDVKRVLPTDASLTESSEFPPFNPLLLSNMFKDVDKQPRVRLIQHGHNRAFEIKCDELPELVLVQMPMK